jgi:hypothetical protein
MAYKQLTQAALKKKYGSSADAVRKNLQDAVIDLGDNKIKVKMHKSVVAAIEAACEHYRAKVSKGKAKAYKLKPSYCGTFNWRLIKHADGTKSTNLSMHSFGIAIDLNAWNPNGQGKSAKSDIPKELVKSMNKYGFYWGGNWGSSSYDPMHFEYAPDSFSSVTSPVKKSTASTAKKEEEPKFKSYKVSTTARLNLRKKPNGTVIKVLPRGKTVTVIGEDGIWLETSGGWIAKAYTKKV